MTVVGNRCDACGIVKALTAFPFKTDRCRACCTEIVYFIGNGDALNYTEVKIGWTTKDPRTRMAQLQTGNASKLVLLATQPGTRGTEDALHSRFARWRRAGEWFARNDELHALITASVLPRAEEARKPVVDRPRVVRPTTFTPTTSRRHRSSQGEPVLARPTEFTYRSRRK